MPTTPIPTLITQMISLSDACLTGEMASREAGRDRFGDGFDSTIVAALFVEVDLTGERRRKGDFEAETKNMGR